MEIRMNIEVELTVNLLKIYDTPKIDYMLRESLFLKRVELLRLRDIDYSLRNIISVNRQKELNIKRKEKYNII